MESWEKHGGKGAICVRGDRPFLDVYNSQYVHDLLHEFLIVDSVRDLMVKSIAMHDVSEVKKRVRKNKDVLRYSYRLTEYDKQKEDLKASDRKYKDVYGNWVKFYPLSANGASLLHVASALGNTEIVECILCCGGDADRVDLYGRTALFYASSRQISQVLLDAQTAKPNKDSCGRTPLFYAREKGQIQLLIDAGYDVQARDSICGSLPIHVAAHLGHTGAVVMLAKKGNDINAINNQGRTPLDEACRSGKSRTAAKLLGLGAHIKASNARSYSAFHHAVEGHCSNSLLARLVEAGADVNDQRNPLRETPLHIAARIGDVRAAKFLLRNGASVSVRNAENKKASEVAGSIDAYESPDLQFRPYYAPTSAWRKTALRKMRIFRLIQESSP
jgi:ankyrin repeat protein